MRFAFLALVFTLGWGFPANLQAQDKTPDQQRIRKLIENLGHPKFTERDRAARELEGIGADGLDQLRQTTKSDDVEISCRATKLVAVIEHRIVTTKMLAPKRVRLNVKDVSVVDAVATLAKLGSCVIDIAGDRTALADRKITLDTGEVSFWEAFDNLCRTGGMAEHVSLPATQPAYYGPNGYVPNNQSQGPRPIVVVDGVARDRPTCFAGSVRVRAMPVENAGSAVPAGETHITLDLSAEPRLQNFGVLGSPILDRAIDDHGKTLSLAPPLPIDPTNAMASQLRGDVGWKGRRSFFVESTPMQSTVTLRLRNGDKATKSLKEISGKVTVQTLGETEKFATVNDILKAAGQKVHRLDGSTVHITSINHDGELTIQLTVENDGAPNAPLRVRGNFKGNIHSGGIPFGGPANYPKLHDAQGKVYSAELTGMRSNGFAQQVTLTYRPQGEPSQLTFYGQRILTFDVPFTLKNVTLP